MLFLDLLLLLITLTCEFRCHRAGSQLKMSEHQTKAGNQECFEKLDKLTLFHFHYFCYFHYFYYFYYFHNFHSLIHSLSTCWTTFVFMSMLKSHSLTLSHSHNLSHSFTLSRHAEQLLFSCLCSKIAVYCRKLQWDILGPQQHHPHLWVWSS